jgi:hypothetical protein
MDTAALLVLRPAGLQENGIKTIIGNSKVRLPRITVPL